MLRRLHSKLKATWWILRGHAVVYRGVYDTLLLHEWPGQLLIVEAHLKGSPAVKFMEAPPDTPGRA